MAKVNAALRYRDQPPSTSVVEVDWTHPASVGLEIATFASDEPLFYNVAQGNSFTDSYAPFGSYPKLTNSDKGRGRTTIQGGSSNVYLSSDPGAAVHDFIPPPSNSQGTLLICVRIRSDWLTSTTGIMSFGDVGGWDICRLQYGPDNKFQGSSVYSPTLPSDVVGQVGGYYVVAYTNDARSGSALQNLFVNGVKQSSASNSTSVQGKVLRATSIGTPNAGEPWDLLAGFVWSRALSDAELIEMSANPYQLFKQKGRRRPDTLPLIAKLGLYLSSIYGWFTQSPSSSTAKPIVLYNGEIRQRVSTEGIPMILDQGALRTLATTETLAPIGPVIATYDTWSTIDKNASISITSGVTATNTASTTGAARATLGKTTGKWYWEVKMTKTTASIGLGTAAAGLSANLGTDNLSIGYANSGSRTTGGVSTTLASYTITDTIGVALDMDNKTIEFFKNNVSQGKIAIPTPMQGAALFPMVSLTTTKNAAVTANFGATALTYAAPSGFALGIGN